MAHVELMPGPLRDRLARFPAALRALAGIASEQDARWKPAPEHWSILEVCCHLLDEEREDFRARLQLTLRDPALEWPALDLEGIAQRRRYNERDLRAVLDDFAAERAASIAWLDTIVADAPQADASRANAPRADAASTDWSRAKQHARFGPLAAGMLLASWAAHDALHLRQIARRLHELAARDAGPFEVKYAGDW